MSTSLFADEISFLSDPWCPYACRVDSEREGILVEVAREIFQKHGHELKYKEVNWARAVSLVRDGKANAVVGAYITDAPDFIFPKKEFLSTMSCFYTLRSSNWNYKGISSLKDKSILKILSYSYGAKLDEYFSKSLKQKESGIITLTGLDIEKRQIEILARGRVDTVIEDHLVFKYNVERYNKLTNSNLKFRNAGCLAEEKMYIGFSPARRESKKYISILESGLESMKKDGRLEKIINSYKLQKK